MEQVTKDTLISDLIRQHPETRSVFAARSMFCTSCMGAPDETVESSARMHGIDVEQLIAELNQAIEQSRDRFAP